MIVVGEKEAAAGTIALRSRVAGEIGEMTLERFLADVAGERLPGSRPTYAPRATASEA